MLLILALIAGVFGIHGLVSEPACPSGHLAMGSAAVAMAASPSTTSHSDTATSDTATSDTATSDASMSAAGSASAVMPMTTTLAGPRDMGPMLMLCLAIVTAVAAGLVVLASWLRTATAKTISPPLRGRILRRLRAARMPSGPPAVWEFSVIRC